MWSWSTIQTILFLFGPFLLPRIISTYRQLRNPPQSQLRPLPKQASYALWILFSSATLFFLSTLPIVHPQNIFRATHSRLQTNPGVLLTRLAALRPLTADDESLRALFDLPSQSGGLASRLLYARYGPTTLLANPLCRPGDLDASTTYLLYALPGLLLPHIGHLVALGLATSPTFAGPSASRWRLYATLAACGLAAADIAYLARAPDAPNLRAARANDVTYFYWNHLTFRGLGVAGADMLLAYGIYLSATGRFFHVPKPAAERLVEHGRRLEVLVAKARGLGVVRNAVVRDAGLRRRGEAYWVREGEVMKDVFEQPEVLAAQRRVLGRVDLGKVGREAEGFVDGLLGEVRQEDGGR